MVKRHARVQILAPSAKRAENGVKKPHFANFFQRNSVSSLQLKFVAVKNSPVFGPLCIEERVASTTLI